MGGDRRPGAAPSAAFRFERSACIVCGACANVCPSGAIAREEDEKSRTLRRNAGLCLRCGLCRARCSVAKAVVCDGSGADSVSAPLVRCSTCGRPVGATPHLAWVFHRLGERAFANRDLLAHAFGLSLVRCARCRRHRTATLRARRKRVRSRGRRRKKS